jgi:hypothetical protein
VELEVQIAEVYLGVLARYIVRSVLGATLLLESALRYDLEL